MAQDDAPLMRDGTSSAPRRPTPAVARRSGIWACVVVRSSGPVAARRPFRCLRASAVPRRLRASAAAARAVRAVSPHDPVPPRPLLTRHPLPFLLSPGRARGKERQNVPRGAPPRWSKGQGVRGRLSLLSPLLLPRVRLLVRFCVRNRPTSPAHRCRPPTALLARAPCWLLTRAHPFVQWPAVFFLALAGPNYWHGAGV